jgi:hypothetical protein
MSGLLRAMFRPFLRMTGQVVLNSFGEEDSRTLRSWHLTDRWTLFSGISW